MCDGSTDSPTRLMLLYKRIVTPFPRLERIRLVLRHRFLTTIFLRVYMLPVGTDVRLSPCEVNTAKFFLAAVSSSVTPRGDRVKFRLPFLGGKREREEEAVFCGLFPRCRLNSLFIFLQGSLLEKRKLRASFS